MLGIVVLILGAAGVHWWTGSEHVCGQSALGCDLGVHVIGTAIVAAISFALIFLRREGHAAALQRRKAREHPEQLLTRWLPPEDGVTSLATRLPSSEDAVPRSWRDRLGGLRSDGKRGVSFVDFVISRDGLARDMADDLDDGPGAQLLVGPTGSGKTMVLLKLAPLLARQGLVPVVFSLLDSSHDSGDLDFERQAREAYRREFPKRTDEEADKQWRWLIRGGQIVVIIDDLEKTRAAPHDVVHALEQVGSRFRVVAATRRNGIPADYKRGRIDLEALNPKQVCADLASRLTASRDGLDDDHARAIVIPIVTAANIPSTPYYFAIARVLANLGLLPEVSHEGDARLNLLVVYRGALESGALRLNAGLDLRTRKRVLEDLEWIAFVRMLGTRSRGRKLNEVESRLRDLGAPNLDTRSVVDYAKRLGLLSSQFDSVVRFGHPTTMAFFASCLLARCSENDALWDELLEGDGFGTEASLACVFAHGRLRDADLADATCRRLLERPSALRVTDSGGRVPDGDQRILILKTALEIAASSGGSKEVIDRLIREAAAQRHRDGVAREQIELVQDVARLHSAEKNEALWEFATDALDYRVKREAMRLLRKEAKEAPGWMVQRIEQTVREATMLCRQPDCSSEDDRGEPFDSLRAVAWALPSLRSACTDPAQRKQLKGYQEALPKLASRLTQQRGLEATIADGLKLEAMNNPQAAPDSVACEMLEPGDDQAAFWFSRVLLLQAIARRSVGRSDAERGHALISGARGDRHHFVRQTAELCATALESGTWEPYIWDDLTEIAAGADSELGVPARQLIGEIVLALNMNEHADEQLRIDFGNSDELPWCLEHSRDRSEILGTAQQKDCPFAKRGNCLCPYTYHPPEVGIRRELSRAFCRHQRIHATEMRHSSMTTKDLRMFWHRMEDLARF